MSAPQNTAPPISRREVIDRKEEICREVVARLSPLDEDQSMIVTGIYNTPDREGVRICFDDGAAPDEVLIPWPGGVEAYSRPGLVDALVEAITERMV